jgi:hypothetical protein
MRTILVAPEMRMTKRFIDAVCYQDFNVMRAEHSEAHKRQLNMRWVVVTDEHGKRRLQMRWTGARSSVPPTSRSSTSQSVQPAMGRGSDPTPGPEAQLNLNDLVAREGVEPPTPAFSGLRTTSVSPLSFNNLTLQSGPSFVTTL